MKTQQETPMRRTGSSFVIAAATVLAFAGGGCQAMRSFTQRVRSSFVASQPTTQPAQDTAEASKTGDPADEDGAEATTRQSKEPEVPLYVRLGGEGRIVALVDDFLPRALANPKVNFARSGTPRPWQPTPQNLDRLKTRFVQFLATATGGPQKYEGEDMVTAHKGMRITGAEFDALVADLTASMQTLRIGEREQKDLHALVHSARGAIVENP
jgi:hemoglobin